MAGATLPRVASAWAALLMCVLCGACDGGDGRYYGTTKPKHGPDELWYNLFSEPEYLDPGLASDSASGLVLTNLFAGLTQLHPTTLEPMPDVARSWDIDEGGRRYVFHLRPTRWSDGTPVTAADFAYAWRRVLDPKTASKYASFLFPLRYAEEANHGALMVRGVPADVDEAAILRWVGDAARVDRVRLAPELGAAFLHVTAPDGTDRDEHGARLSRALSARAFRGVHVSVGKAGTDVVGVRALSDLELEVRLNHPLPYFLSIASFYTAKPVPRHLLARLKASGVTEALWTRPEYIVSNGAYRLAEWRFRRYMTLVKNPRYWDAANVAMPRVRLLMVDSANTTLSLYKAGELDHIGQSSLPSEFIEQLARFGDFERHPYLGTYFLWLNTAEPPLDNPLVREALSLAIDRESLAKFVLRGGQVPTRDLVPSGLAGYQGVGRVLFDPAAAKETLAKAGYGPDKPLPTIVYRYNTSEGHKQVAEAIQQMWKEHLGVSVRLENEEWKVYLKHLNQTEFQVARMGWIGDYADPYTFLELLTKSNGNNHSNWSRPDYDDLLEQANRATGAPRLALMRRAEARMLADNPIIPLYVYTRLLLVKPYLKGAFSNYQNVTQFKYMSIDKRYYDGVPAERTRVPPPPSPTAALSAPEGRGAMDALPRPHEHADAGPASGSVL